MPRDADEVADRTLRLAPLIVRVDLAPQGDPAVRHGDLHRVVRDLGVPGQRVGGGRGDVEIRTLIAGRQAYLDLVSDGFDPAHPQHGALGGPLLAEAVHPPGERHQPFPDGDADLTRLHLGVPLQLVDHLLLNVLIGEGGRWDGHGGSFRAADGSPEVRPRTGEPGSPAPG